ncbi:unnamed protein product [Closterium sp. NIES-54]
MVTSLLHDGPRLAFTEGENDLCTPRGARNRPLPVDSDSHHSRARPRHRVQNPRRVPRAPLPSALPNTRKRFSPAAPVSSAFCRLPRARPLARVSREQHRRRRHVPYGAKISSSNSIDSHSFVESL